MAEPAVVYEVAIYGDHEEPAYRTLFTDRTLAEAYQAKLPGSDLEEVPIQAEVPELVTVHHYETYVMPDGMSMSPKPPYLHHRSQEHWSHNVWPEPKQWTSPGSHHHRRLLTTEPRIVVLETWGYGERATRDAHLDEAQRIREELGTDA